MTDLIKSLRIIGERSSADGRGSRFADEAADALEANAALIALLRASLNKVEDEVEGLRKDAGRYRWLRQQQWNEADMFVVAGSKSQVRLGTDCPSLDRLDDAIDAVLAVASQTSEEKT